MHLTDDSRPASTLILLVTCSRDESRRDLAIAVTKNLVAMTARAGLDRSLVVFDNASTFPDHLQMLPAGTIVCRADVNIGYWSAIKWVLDNRRTLFDRDFANLYLVESDLYHDDLNALAKCEAFLANEPRASGVRTQEFSVRWRWRFNKSLRRLPMHVSRSQVSLVNAVTGEKAWFRPVDGAGGIYLSNLHPKLPALNRMSTVEKVFSSLAAMPDFTELDFFRLMMSHQPLIGVFDGGLFHSLVSFEDQHTVVMSSYADSAKMNRLGYLPTRASRISPVQADITIDRIQ